MFELGIQEKEYEDEEYTTKYLSQLEIGEKITGNINISDIKTQKYKGKIKNTFYVIITNHDEEKKWICGLNTAVYENYGEITIYGKKGGRVYGFIDSLNHAMNQTILEERKNYSVDFPTFRNNINDKIVTVTVETVKSEYSSAKAPNLHVKKVELKEEETETKTSDIKVDLDTLITPKAIDKLKKCNPDLYDAIDTLNMGHFDITSINIIKELKKMRQEGSLTLELYNEARKDLQKNNY